MFKKPLFYLPLIGLIITALLKGLYREQASAVTANTTHETIDYYAYDFMLSTFGKNGNLRQQVSGHKLTHIDGQPSLLQLEQPESRILSGKWKNWTLQARQAEYSKQDNRWNFLGAVEINKYNGTELPIAIKTSRLNFEPQNNTLNTSAEVTITHPHGHTESTGMTIYLNTDQIQLTSSVTSHYRP